VHGWIAPIPEPPVNDTTGEPFPATAARDRPRSNTDKNNIAQIRFHGVARQRSAAELDHFGLIVNSAVAARIASVSIDHLTNFGGIVHRQSAVFQSSHDAITHIGEFTLGRSQLHAG